MPLAAAPRRAAPAWTRARPLFTGASLEYAPPLGGFDEDGRAAAPALP